MPVLLDLIGDAFAAPAPQPIFIDADLHAIVIQTIGFHKPTDPEGRLLQSLTAEVKPLGLLLAVTVVSHPKLVGAVLEQLYGVEVTRLEVLAEVLVGDGRRLPGSAGQQGLVLRRGLQEHRD